MEFVQMIHKILKVVSFHWSLELKLLEKWKKYWCVSDIKIIQTIRKSIHLDFIMFFTMKLSTFLNILSNSNVW